MSKKRADRRTGGLFPDLERKPGQRFASKRINRPWSPAQEAVMVAAVCACQSRAVYDVMIPNLMEAIGHQPIYPENSNVSPRKHLENCVRALELRIVSKMLRGKDWEHRAIMGFPIKFRDPYQPLTWGERNKIIRPWWRRKPTDRIIEGELHMILGRRADGDFITLMDGYLDDLWQSDGKLVDEEMTPSPIPVTIAAVPVLRLAVINLDQMTDLNKAGDQRIQEKLTALKSNICRGLGY